MLAQRAVQHEGQVIGYVRPIWQQADPYTWIEQWVLDDERVSFDTYDDACAYLMERHARESADERA
jgi:hypothetical protein